MMVWSSEAINYFDFFLFLRFGHSELRLRIFSLLYIYNMYIYIYALHNQVLFDIIAWFSMRPGTENSKVESAARAGITIVAPT